MKRVSVAAAIVLSAALLFAAGTLVNGSFRFLKIATPASPAAGYVQMWADSTNNLMSDKTSAGTVHHMVATSSCSGGTPVVGNINADGSVTCASSGSPGALVLVEQHASTSGTAIAFTSCISSSYDEYMIELVGVQTTGTTFAQLGFRFSTDRGGTWITSGYGWRSQVNASGSVGGQGSNSAGAINWTTATTSAAGDVPFNATVRLFNPASTTAFHTMSGQVTEYGIINGNSTTAENIVFSGTDTQKTAVTAFELLLTNGSTPAFAAGNVRCYGIVK